MLETSPEGPKAMEKYCEQLRKSMFRTLKASRVSRPKWRTREDQPSLPLMARAADTCGRVQVGDGGGITGKPSQNKFKKVGGCVCCQKPGSRGVQYMSGKKDRNHEVIVGMERLK